MTRLPLFLTILLVVISSTPVKSDVIDKVTIAKFKPNAIIWQRGDEKIPIEEMNAVDISLINIIKENNVTHISKEFPTKNPGETEIVSRTGKRVTVPDLSVYYRLYFAEAVDIESRIDILELNEWIEWYNEHYLHAALGYRTPNQVQAVPSLRRPETYKLATRTLLKTA